MKHFSPFTFQLRVHNGFMQYPCNTLAIPLPLRYHLERICIDKHGMVTGKIGISKIKDSYKY